MQLSTRQFTYYPRDRQFVAEMSELAMGGRRRIWHQIYPDACDVGINVVSHRTGKEVTYVLAETKRSAYGDILHWVLTPVATSSLEAADTSVLIFND